MAKYPAPLLEVPIAIAYPTITTIGGKIATAARFFIRSEMDVATRRIIQAMIYTRIVR